MHVYDLNAAQRAVYHKHLQSDHDFRVWVDVLTMEERFVSSVDVLDGQVNYSETDDGPWRTATLVLSDPDGVLDYGTSFTRDDSDVLWVNRLVRIQQEVKVPTLGVVTATVMVGLPVSVSREGAELRMELGDKSLLADHGVRPVNYKKGMRADVAIRKILRDLTGEHHLRVPVPARKRRLSKPVKVGMGADSLTPWAAAKLIARRDLNWNLYYSADGYATARHRQAAGRKVIIEHVLSLPKASTDFSDFANYAKVTSVRKVSLRGKEEGKDGKQKRKSVTMRFQSVAVLPKKHDLSEQSLSRNKVRRTLPVVVQDNDLKNQKRVNRRARDELNKASGVEVERSYEVIPMFHLDAGYWLDLPEGIGKVPFNEVSIPLGVGGNMSLGAIKWVSRPVRVKRAKNKSTVVKKKRKKGGRKDDA